LLGLGENVMLIPSRGGCHAAIARRGGASVQRLPLGRRQGRRDGGFDQRVSGRELIHLGWFVDIWRGLFDQWLELGRRLIVGRRLDVGRSHDQRRNHDRWAVLAGIVRSGFGVAWR
jgi:hypothetical protein